MSQLRRVLFFINSLEPGGAERQVASLVRQLQKQVTASDEPKLQPLLYLKHRQGPLLDNLPADVPVFSFDDGEDDHASTGIYLPGRMHRRVVNHLRQILRREQIDVLYERTFLQSLVGAAAAKTTACRRIAFISSNPIANFSLVAGRFQWMKHRMLKRAYRTANAVACGSEGVRLAAADFYSISPSAIEVCPNHVDVDAIDTHASEPRPGELKGETFNVLATGRLCHAKAFDQLFDAVALLSADLRQRIRLFVLGDGELRGALEGQIKQLQLEQTVHLVGHVDNPYRWMKHADLLCLSSRYEGMPNVLIEGLVCQIPIVSFDCDFGPREILDEGQHGQLVPAGDVTALSESIAAAASHKRDTAALSRGRDWAVSKYSLPAACKRLEALAMRE